MDSLRAGCPFIRVPPPGGGSVPPLEGGLPCEGAPVPHLQVRSTTGPEGLVEICHGFPRDLY